MLWRASSHCHHLFPVGVVSVKFGRSSHSSRRGFSVIAVARLIGIIRLVVALVSMVSDHGGLGVVVMWSLLMRLDVLVARVAELRSASDFVPVVSVSTQDHVAVLLLLSL